MQIFEFRNSLLEDYKSYIHSFIKILDQDVDTKVRESLDQGLLWPEPLIQLNPAFEPGERVDELVTNGLLHPECKMIFRRGKSEFGNNNSGESLRLHKHQADALKVAKNGHNYVLTTGTGSGKSLSYIVPIVDFVLRNPNQRGIKAIVIYPMNALANSQEKELEKFLKWGYPEGKHPVTFRKYTGQENDSDRKEILANPPDILLTNYVMLELILTRTNEQDLIDAAQGLRFLVLDELHTYRGRQGADVSMLVRRVRERMNATHLQVVGTSATLASEGTYNDQRQKVAEMATQLFGATVQPQDIIGETLRRTTREMNTSDPAFVEALRRRIQEPNIQPSRSFETFRHDPLSIWIENTFGVVTDNESERLKRADPSSIGGEQGAAILLSELTGVDLEKCREAIVATLLFSYQVDADPVTGFKPFAFRLHQFFSRGETVFASIEEKTTRFITLSPQKFVPGDRSRILLPLVFCRECGQEYYSVRRLASGGDTSGAFEARDLFDLQDSQNGEPGFLYSSNGRPWPESNEEILRRVPEDWLEEHNGTLRVKSSRRKNLPQRITVSTDGAETSEGFACHYVPAPFRFCLHCGVAYEFNQRDDFSKLAALNSGGRSTATTLLSLSTVRAMRDLAGETPKLLSFTDNRQDASLQAGHFNDFVEIGVLRSALYRATVEAGSEGILHDELTLRVFNALKMPLELYSPNKDLKYQQLNQTQRAMRNVLGYRLYRDLKRGWRVTSPNLEQCGLLQISYLSLEELCQDEEIWAACHPNLAQAEPFVRERVAKVLLDYMRRELAIKVEYLDSVSQESIKQQSNQQLKAPWAIDENERLEYSSVLFPRSKRNNEDASGIFLSSRSGYGKYLRRNATWEGRHARPSVDDTQTIIQQLLEVLAVAGLVTIVIESRDSQDVPGYQLPASALVWKAGNGSRAFHDPIRVPDISDSGGRTNPFFVDLYQSSTSKLLGYEAHEHTAQVPYEQRVEREQNFRSGKLPILYCSPTMELGVDIAELNVVNMRNIPPTPANYAQRSGRAGRSGQPAMVFSYCTTGSPHDQYFFKRPGLMVKGAVTPPRLDLTNEDLIRTHVHAIWLGESGLSLGRSLKDLLDLRGDDPTLELRSSVRERVEAEEPRLRAKVRALRMLADIESELMAARWYSQDWVERVLDQIPDKFDEACERWRSLYRTAQAQQNRQNRIIMDASRDFKSKEEAKRLRREAEAQLELLLSEETAIAQSDFYSYRYFASEGFLPGYNFPRLPLSAFIPGRNSKSNESFLSRPRFLAISEFGPRAIIYHEGSRYRITKVIMGTHERGHALSEALLCQECGYYHPAELNVDLCQHCNSNKLRPLGSLFRMQNVATKRQDRINSDEEERMRYGYEVMTGVRFAEEAGHIEAWTGIIQQNNKILGQLTYGPRATIWRMNLGWAKRTNPAEHGFLLNTESGHWAKNQQDAGDQDQNEVTAAANMRVIPYVEDYRNCLIFEPDIELEAAPMASLQAALKQAMQIEYQLEDSELAVEPLPDSDNRRLLLFYESAEGGAGVLRRLLDDAGAISRVALRALEICHFSPTGEDLRRALHAREDCEAACYDCLMSYGNQSEHRLLDRQLIRDFLLDLAGARTVSSPVIPNRDNRLADLLREARSGLEKQWLEWLKSLNLHLPSQAYPDFKRCPARPDFFYEEQNLLIYIDGDDSERQARDATLGETLQYDYGLEVCRFGSPATWEFEIARLPLVFGREKES